MHNIEQRLLFYPMLITVSIGIHLKLMGKKIECSRKDISCEIHGMCTLVQVNKNFSD